MNASAQGRTARGGRPFRNAVLHTTPPIAGAVALSFLAVALSGCGRESRVGSARVPVTVANVERRPVPLEVTASGVVEPIQTANVGSQVGGVVTGLLFREGQDVRAGQPLVQLDPRPFQAALEQALGVLGRDRAQWDNARLEVERAEQLRDQSLISSSEYDQKRAQAEAFREAVAADSAALSKARLDLQYATIRAPIAGRTGDLKVHVGDLVKAATSEPLVTINVLRPIHVRFSVSEGDLQLFRRHRASDMKVVVRLPGDSAEVTGRLAFVDNSVDAATGTLLLKGEFANRDDRLWPGEFVATRLVLAVDDSAVVVPAPAVTLGQRGTYVYVMNADSTVTPRPVEVARTTEDLALITRGVTPGEIVVTDGQFRLAPGSRVMVRSSTAGTTP